MVYATFQSIILVKDSLNEIQRKQIVEDIKNIIYIYANGKKIKILNQQARPLAYKIEEYENALFIAVEFRLESIGANKRIKKIEEQLNTKSDILNYKIIQKDKEQIEETNNDIVYIVYEFDYGDISKSIKPRVTHFGGFIAREKAVIQATKLLEEGLEKYYIESDLVNNENPFKYRDEVHLYEYETEEKQDTDVYYIKIEKINLE